jgi:methylmalonyl-CoA mutase
MKNKLFKEFTLHTNYDWKQQVIKDLKGKNFDENLAWQIDENIQVNSYYDASETHRMSLDCLQQSQHQKFTKSWSNREIIRYKIEKNTNSLVISLLNSGADSFLVDLSGVFDLEFEIKKLLRNIKTSDVPFFFKVENNVLDLVKTLQIIAPYYWKGGIDIDILGRYFSTGIYEENQWGTIGKIIGIVQNFNSFKTLTINGNIFHNAGANVEQELAYTLASAIESLEKIAQQNVSLLVIIQKMEFSISVGTNYFVEIAKIRALRFLWKKILVEGYGLDQTEISPMSIYCITSSFYSSAISPHTNMLRATTESMSAVIGGCDALSVRAYDESYQESDEFSRRIARNVSTILKEESYFDKVIDPSAGSYFIEKLTVEIAENAFKLLEKIENMGGIVEAFKHNFVQTEIKRNFETKQNNLLNNETIMIGVNKFREPNKEKNNRIDNLSGTDPALGFELLQDLRLSSTFEQ